MLWSYQIVNGVMRKVLISAGDASGELHAAVFAKALSATLPRLKIEGLGGPHMERAGVELLVNQRELAVGGLFEVLRDASRIWAIYKVMRTAINETSPDLLVLVDSPDFNLPLARVANNVGIPVLYYITPQVWAWRKYRIKKIANRVDRACVIFPFEKEVFANTGLQVEYVGHPLIERLPCSASSGDKEMSRQKLGFSSESLVFSMFPGSRRNEIEYCLPLYLETARCVATACPSAAFAIGVADSVELNDIRREVSMQSQNSSLDVKLFHGCTYDLIRASDVALAKPGTITLELALLGTPTVVAAKAHGLTAFALKHLKRIPSLSLPNLIAGEPIVSEFLQREARSDKIAVALLELIEGPAREDQKASFMKLAQSLGKGGASSNAAAVAAEMIDGTVRA